MLIEQPVIDTLLSRPAEGLNVELKRWIDPKSDSGVEKIAKAALALRNRNGGYLVIGFDNHSLSPDTGDRPADVHAEFHIDNIQAIISRYASDLFEIGIGFSRRAGIDHPVIVIPPGVRTPVAAKRDLVNNGKTLIRKGAVYFRTLAANGTPSTAEARPEDWRDILEICFDNREADVGRFLRRQLAASDLATMAKFLQQFGVSQTAPLPTLQERAEGILRLGEGRFQKSAKERQVSPEEATLLGRGSWSVALVTDPPHPDARPDRQFSAIIRASNPNYTGWPVWLELKHFCRR